jgi:hypothetical protein
LRLKYMLRYKHLGDIVIMASTSALHAEGRGSTPRVSTKQEKSSARSTLRSESAREVLELEV